jgi:non-ribosomal peptide synthetase component F
VPFAPVAHLLHICTPQANPVAAAPGKRVACLSIPRRGHQPHVALLRFLPAGGGEDLGVVRSEPEPGMEGSGEAFVRHGPGVGMPGVHAMPKGGLVPLSAAPDETSMLSGLGCVAASMPSLLHTDSELS